MYEDEPTYRDPLDTIEDLLAIREHSPTFWDTDAAEQATVDPYDHPSWDVADALAEDGWDDPADAIEIRELLADDVRLTPLADTPILRLKPYTADEAVTEDRLTPEEELHKRLLALAPTPVDYGEQEVWAA